MLERAKLEGFSHVYELQKMCFVRLSFVKGFLSLTIGKIRKGILFCKLHLQFCQFPNTMYSFKKRQIFELAWQIKYFYVLYKHIYYLLPTYLPRNVPNCPRDRSCSDRPGTVWTNKINHNLFSALKWVMLEAWHTIYLGWGADYHRLDLFYFWIGFVLSLNWTYRKIDFVDFGEIHRQLPYHYITVEHVLTKNSSRK